MNFPILFEKCPTCGCTETVCREACKDEPQIPKNLFVSMEKKVTPLIAPTTIQAPTTRVLMHHYDICSDCGLVYCTMVEKQTMRTDILMQLAGGPPASAS